MRFIRLIPASLLLNAALVAVPAAAQDITTPEVERSVFAGDFLIAGAGVVLAPSYEGSDELVAIPAAAVAGKLGGIGINARSAGLALDLVPERKGKRMGLTLGPVLRYRSNRSGKINDPAVASLGKVRGVIEGGVVVGADFKGVFNPHDSLSLGVDWRWDISGRGGGRIISPGVSYLTPISRAQVIGLALTSNFIDDRYANYEFGISAAGKTASGLPVFTAKGGLKDLGLGLMTARDLSGNFLDGGPAIALGAMYSHLYGSAAASPITSARGRRGQWIFGAGVSYTF